MVIETKVRAPYDTHVRREVNEAADKLMHAETLRRKGAVASYIEAQQKLRLFVNRPDCAEVLREVNVLETFLSMVQSTRRYEARLGAQNIHIMARGKYTQSMVGFDTWDILQTAVKTKLDSAHHRRRTETLEATLAAVETLLEKRVHHARDPKNAELPSARRISALAFLRGIAGPKDSAQGLVILETLAKQEVAEDARREIVRDNARLANAARATVSVKSRPEPPAGMGAPFKPTGHRFSGDHLKR